MESQRAFRQAPIDEFAIERGNRFPPCRFQMLAGN